MTDLTEDQAERARIIAQFATHPHIACARWVALAGGSLDEAHETLALAADVESPVAW